MKRWALYIMLLLCCWQSAFASVAEQQNINIKEMVFEHLKDAYSWHITTIGEHHISIPLPVIVRSHAGEWQIFSSSHLEHLGHGDTYKGFYLSHEEGAYKGKIVERIGNSEVRPLDLSLTKTAAAIWISVLLLISLVMLCSRWAKRNPQAAPRGFVGFMEMFIMDINDNICKACIGEHKYQRYAPYLLTVFFFIFLSNLLGLIPVFPGGANVTGNIAITLFLAVCTFIATNFFGSREYYKEVFNPDVPAALKPIMIPIEIIGVFTKPFALMVRLFANILAGHTIILCLVGIIFVTATMGVALNRSMTVVSVLFALFMNALELLVAYIQAYVFTMLSAVFIGLSVQEHHAEHVK